MAHLRGIFKMGNKSRAMHAVLRSKMDEMKSDLGSSRVNFDAYCARLHLLHELSTEFREIEESM